jgi:hypothetical protein
MKKDVDSPAVQRVREARKKLFDDAGGDFKKYLEILHKYESERLGGKSKFRRANKSARAKKTLRGS